MGKKVFKADKYPDVVVIDVAIPEFNETSERFEMSCINGHKTK